MVIGRAQQTEWQRLLNDGRAAAAAHNYKVAEKYLRDAASLAKADDYNHLLIADSLTVLGRVYCEEGLYTLGETALTEAERQYETAYPLLTRLSTVLYRQIVWDGGA